MQGKRDFVAAQVSGGRCADEARPHRGCSRSGASCWLPACRWVAIRPTLHSCYYYMPSNPQIRCFAADNLWQPSSLLCLGVLTLGPFTFLKPRTPG